MIISRSHRHPRLAFLACASLGWITLLALGCGPAGPRQLTVRGNVRSKEGWPGKRYTENRLTVAEEFDAVGNDGRIDLWRFHEEGVLILEERDTNSDGKIDHTAQFDPKKAELWRYHRDSNLDGATDIWVTYKGGGIWRQTWDRNHDSVIDLVFIFAGPSELLTELALDYHQLTDLRKSIARTRWQEIALDRNFDSAFDAWVRFHKGQAHERGIGRDVNGQPERWVAIPQAPAYTTDAPVLSSKEEEDTYVHITSIGPGRAAELKAQQATGPKPLSAPSTEAEETQDKVAPRSRRRGPLARIRRLFRRQPREDVPASKDSAANDRPPSARVQVRRISDQEIEEDLAVPTDPNGEPLPPFE